MMRKLLIIFFCTGFSAVTAQELDTWKILSEVEFVTKSIDESGFEMDSPQFSKKLMSYNGKKITLKGYLIPLSEVGDKSGYMLSSLPFNSCFFCGGAGPETVVEVQTKQTIDFTTRLIVMEGILFLNETDPDHHMYIIKNAKRID